MFRKRLMEVLYAFLALVPVFFGLFWLAALMVVVGLVVVFLRSPNPKVRSIRQQKWLVYPVLFLGVFVLAIIFKTLVLCLYKIPSSSMERTIHPGSVVWVNKFVYGPKLPKNPYEVPWFNLLYWALHKSDTAHVMPSWAYRRLGGFGTMQRGDVVVFEHPDNDEIFIKRCVGLPGDTLQIVRSKTIVNQKLLPSPPLALYSMHPVLDTTYAVFPYHKSNWSIDNYGPIVIPRKGMRVRLNSFSVALYRTIIKRFEGGGLTVENNLYYLNGKVVEDYEFKNDYCFVMGDNRHDSNDSRYFGFVPLRNVIGKAAFIIYAEDLPFGVLRKL